jgi:hypothetical protein
MEHLIAELRHDATDITVRIEAIWKLSPAMEFKNQNITTSDLTVITSAVTSVSFVNCQSKEWIEISQRLAAISQPKMLNRAPPRSLMV